MAQPLNILILEDNRTDAELTLFEMEEGGLSVAAKVVENEKDYVRALEQTCYDLILSDYDLPQYSGASALLEAKKRCPDTPFILVTGAVSEDRAVQILTQGAKDYVLKRNLQLRLVPAIQRALAEAEEQRARKKAEEELRLAHKNLERQVAERTAELQKELERRRQIEATMLKYNERLEILSYTSGRLLASDNPLQLVEELCTRVMAFLDCQAFFNFLVDESAGRLHLNACAGIPPEAAREIEWLDFGVAICGCAARDGLRIVAENIPTTPDVRTELVKSFGIKAYACHPLMKQNQVIGTLSFGARNRTTFSTDDLAMMKAVADQVAIAMNRVKIEDALRESELRERIRSGEMQAVMDMAPVAVWIAHDPQCRYITGNRYADEIMQVPPDANVSASAGPGDAAVSYKVLRNGVEMKPEELPAQVAAATGRPVDAEMMDIVFADGRVVRMIQGAMPLFDAEGRVRGSVAAGTDITGRRMLEEELRETTERFEMAQHAAQVGTWDWNILTGDLRWSDQMFHLFRLDPQKSDASFEVWEWVLHPEDIELARNRINDALQQKTTLNSDYRIVLPDGQIRWINSIGESQYDDEGRPIRMIGICMDITDRRQAEDAAKRNIKQIHALFSRMRSAILFLGKDGVELANQAFCDYFGLQETPADLTGLTADAMIEKIKSAYLHPEKEVNRIQEILDRGEPVIGEEIGLCGERTCLRDYLPILVDGNMYGRLWNHTDITKRKQAEFQKDEALRALERDITERKQVEVQRESALQALRESEEKYRNLVRYAPAAIYEMDVQGTKFFSVNDVMCDLLGYSRAELLLMKPADLLDQKSRLLFSERMKKKISGEKMEETAEYRIRRKNGEWIDTVVNVGAIFFTNEEPFRVVVIGHDITERKKIETTLRKSEARFRALAEEMPHFVWENGADGITVYANKRFYDYTGLNFEQTKAGGWLAVQHPEDMPKVEAAWRQALAACSEYDLEYRIRHAATGQYRWFRVKGTPIRDAAGKITHWVGTCTDIHDQKQANEALRDSEQRLKFHFENSPLAVVEWNADFIVTEWSGEAERIFGWNKEEVIGKRIDALNMIYEPDISIVNGTMEKLTSGENHTVVATNRNCTKSGTVIECTWHNSAIFNPEGKMESVMSLVEDITERQRIEKAILLAKEEWERTFDTVPDLITILDNHHRIVRVNKAMADRLGMVPERCIGLFCHEAVHGMFELAILQKRDEATGIEWKMAIHFLESDQSAGWFKSNSKGV